MQENQKTLHVQSRKPINSNDSDEEEIHTGKPRFSGAFNGVCYF